MASAARSATSWSRSRSAAEKLAFVHAADLEDPARSTVRHRGQPPSAPRAPRRTGRPLARPGAASHRPVPGSPRSVPRTPRRAPPRCPSRGPRSTPTAAATVSAPPSASVEEDRGAVGVERPGHLLAQLGKQVVDCEVRQRRRRRRSCQLAGWCRSPPRPVHGRPAPRILSERSRSALLRSVSVDDLDDEAGRPGLAIGQARKRSRGCPRDPVSERRTRRSLS